MSFRKIFPFVFLFFLGAILGRPMAFSALGLFVKTALYFDKGWTFHYDSIDYEKGQIFFSNIEIKEKQNFSLRASELVIHLGKKHLDFNEPYLVLSAVPTSNKESDWTLSLHEGIVEGEGFKKARFSFEKSLPNELGRLCLEWEKSVLTLEAIRQGKELWIDAKLKNWDASFFEKWPECRGVVDGSLHFVLESNTWKKGSAHLNLENLSYGDWFSNLDGMIDWEGDAVSCLPSSWSDLKKAQENSQERLRLILTKGSIQGSLERIEILKGDLSFKSGLGAKWEFEANVFPKLSMPSDFVSCQWHGRAFLHEERSHWLESELHFHDAYFRLRGDDISANVLWEIECEKVGSLEWALAQPFLTALDPRLADFQWVDGYLVGKAKIGPFLEENYGWNVSYNVSDFVGKYNQAEIGCKFSEGSFFSEGEKGNFLMEDGHFCLALSSDKILEGKSWKGKGQIEGGKLIDSFFQGKTGDMASSIQVMGSLDEFRVETKTQNLMLSMVATAQEDLFNIAIEKGNIDGFCFSGNGSIDQNWLFSLHISDFQGPLTPLFRQLGWSLPSMEGTVASTGFGVYINGSPLGVDWSCQAKGSFCAVHQEQIIPFYCPLLEKKGEDLTFDIRFEGNSWEWMRLYGQSKAETQIFLDSQRSHFLGEPIEIMASLDDEGFKKVSMEFDVDCRSLSLVASLFKKPIELFSFFPIQGTSNFSLNYERDVGSSLALRGKDLSWKGDPLDLNILAKGKGVDWEILQCQMRDVSLYGKIAWDNDIFRLYEGKGALARGIEACFEGSMDSSFRSELHLSHVCMDLSAFHSWTQYLDIPVKKVEGILQGEGCIAWKEKLEADFDFTASGLKTGVVEWENRGPLHFYYSSKEGISFSGLDFCGAKAHGEDLPDLSCKIDLLSYDPSCSRWFLNGAHVHLPFAFLQRVPELNRYLYGFTFEQDIDFFADFCGNRDFSKITCCMKEGFIPIGGAVRHLENLNLCCSEEEISIQCNYLHQGHLLKMSLDADLDAPISGKLTFESMEYPVEEGQLPLTVCWNYTLEKGFSFKEVEGTFAGLEASFHAINEDSSLIGSARFDCSIFAEMVPPEIAELFSDLKMGKGYELKGRISFPDGSPFFSGLLSGKQMDLFGYQLRTLLARIELGPHKVHIHDLKISDSAGILKIEEILAEAKEEKPWTIEIPHLVILELRPSLLQKSGGEPGSISPLVVREFKMDGFKGLLDDSKTYTAHGELSFINSYRREHTVFDIPADLLGRIVGLDLKLLIPACGKLSYEMKDSKFFLKELTDAYSEGKRSEFFLVPTDPVPIMDFNGKLQVLVKCKQFVLFKFMESFMISIEGELNDPKFRLQKKRRFWGL